VRLKTDEVEEMDVVAGKQAMEPEKGVSREKTIKNIPDQGPND